MLLIDFSQIFHASTHSCKNQFDNEEMKNGILHHYILLEILNIITQFKQEYGRPIFAIDDKSQKSWRKKLFPHYKAGRKEKREGEKELWEIAYPVADEIIEVLREMGHIVISVPEMEADDVIAILAKSSEEPVMIVSSDGDFKQLHKYQHIKQYNPIRKEPVTCDDPRGYLIEHIAKGEAKTGDGIPNILSPNDFFVNPEYAGKRQKPITKKLLGEINDRTYFIDAPKELINRWTENRNLIDFEQIPVDLQDRILTEYQNVIDAAPEKIRTRPLYNFMVKKRMTKLLEDIQNFA